MYRLLAEATKAAHFAYLAFVILGGFLAWRWPKAIVAHLGAASWGVVLIAGRTNCPLTYVEDRLRRRAGQPGLPRGFIDTYIKGVLYPTRYAEQVRMLAGAVIVLSWLGAYMMRRAPRRATYGVRNYDRDQWAMVPWLVAVNLGPVRGTTRERGLTRPPDEANCAAEAARLRMAMRDRVDAQVRPARGGHRRAGRIM
jgi:Protein of Unknown function (DUF2784)